MEENHSVPRIGVGVIVRKDNKVLLGKRINSHGHNTWNFPGGHLDFMETPEQCGIRETLEETGIEITKIRRGPYTNDFFETEKKHYITLFMIADWKNGKAQVPEPDKCLEWQWYEWNNLPHPLFLPTQNLIKTDYSPF